MEEEGEMDLEMEMKMEVCDVSYGSPNWFMKPYFSLEPTPIP